MSEEQEKPAEKEEKTAAGATKPAPGSAEDKLTAGIGQAAPDSPTEVPGLETTSSLIKTKIGRKLSTKEAAPQKRRERKLGDYFTGRRKSSIARVALLKGSGKITVNKKELADFFKRKTLQFTVQQPLTSTNKLAEYDVKVNVRGGGNSGQAAAVRLGIARALAVVEPSTHKALRQAGFLTRDSRMVERKKYGLHKARRAPQFSKR